MIEFDLLTHLAADADIAALVGSRIYVEQGEQGGSKPTIVIRLLPGATRHYHSTGASGLVEADLEITANAGTYEAARNVYEAIRDAIDGFKGTWDTTDIDRAVLSTPASVTAAPVHGDEPGGPAVRATVHVFYYESVPSLGAAS